MKAALKEGQEMKLGDSLVSPNGLAKLVLQEDGNLVLYRIEDNHVLWSPYTQGKAVDRAVMQGDNNFVLYSGTNHIWRTETSSVPGSGPGGWIQVQDDGNVVVYNAGSKHLWASYTSLTDWQRCQVLEAGPSKDGNIYIKMRNKSTPPVFGEQIFTAFEPSKKEMLTVALTAISTGLQVRVELSSHNQHKPVLSMYLSPGY